MEKWIRQSGSSTEAVAKRSRHKTAHVLDLFADENPNPSLRLYLELASVAGARFGGVQDTTPAAVVAHLATVAKDNEIALASLARASSVGRPLLSTLFNDPDPNPSLATVDRIVTALDAASDFDLVPATQAIEDEADDAEAEADDGEAEADDGEADDGEADDAEVDDAEADDAEDDDAEDDAEDDADEAEADGADDAEDDADDSDEADDDEADDADEDAEADDAHEDAEPDDEAQGDEQVAAVGALREQNTQLQRRVVTREAEIDYLREQGRWSTLKKLAAAVGGGLVGAGITVAVLKRRKD